jgi:hypothetical protein
MGAAGAWTRPGVRARVRAAEAQCPAQLKRKVPVVVAGLIQTSTGRHASPAMWSGGEGDQPRQATCSHYPVSGSGLPGALLAAAAAATFKNTAALLSAGFFLFLQPLLLIWSKLSRQVGRNLFKFTLGLVLHLARVLVAPLRFLGDWNLWLSLKSSFITHVRPYSTKISSIDSVSPPVLEPSWFVYVFFL